MVARMSQAVEFALPAAKRQRRENGTAKSKRTLQRGSRLFAPYRVGVYLLFGRSVLMVRGPLVSFLQHQSLSLLCPWVRLPFKSPPPWEGSFRHTTYEQVSILSS